MQVTPLRRNEAFDPELLEAMSAAFSQARRALGLSDRADPFGVLLARHIIEAAQRGMRTKTALYLSAMIEFKAHLH